LGEWWHPDSMGTEASVLGNLPDLFILCLFVCLNKVVIVHMALS
jgi:hypothetical protein